MSSLLVRSADRICALPLAAVTETMRELECVPCRDVPVWVRGASVVRGHAVPVVDLSVLLGGVRSETRGRFVTIRSGSGTVALLVDEIVGVRNLANMPDASRTPLLEAADANHGSQLGTLDGQLLAVLDVASILPEELHTKIVTESRA